MTHPIFTTATTTQASPSNEDMSYVIQPEESFAEGIRRIVQEQVQRAIRHLWDETDVHAGVHDARRHLKITRAAWRLIREDLHPKDFREKNAFYRDAGRRLSELRDLTALLETLDMLQENNPRVKRWVSQQAFRQLLEEKRTEMPAQGLTTAQTASLPHDVAGLLEANYAEINEFQLSDQYPANVLASLRKVYARGRKAHRACKKAADPERMHEWRKRCKYLRYHFHMLRNAWPALFTTLEDEFHRLTDFLGDFNNLTVMKKHLAAPDYSLKEIYRKKLNEEAEKYQEQLWRSSISLGDRLFAERPEAFAKRLEKYLSDLISRKEQPAAG